MKLVMSINNEYKAHQSKRISFLRDGMDMKDCYFVYQIHTESWLLRLYSTLGFVYVGSTHYEYLKPARGGWILTYRDA